MHWQNRKMYLQAHGLEEELLFVFLFALELCLYSSVRRALPNAHCVTLDYLARLTYSTLRTIYAFRH